MKAVLASKNPHKLAEIQAILSGLGVEVVMESELGLDIDVDETGTTFEENSLLKAEAVMKASGLPVLADDSGLMVDSLDGAPGVYSARYGHKNSDAERIDYLLANLKDVPAGSRAAKFVCVITCLWPDGRKIVRFEPVSAWETPGAIAALCDAFRTAMQDTELDPLLLIPIFILDFLCIHPFNDGNGRMSRLLTLLLLYRSGYIVGKYISIEKLISNTKETYYEALQESSCNWHEGTNDYAPFVTYMLGVLTAAYRDFESRIELLATKGLSKPDRVREIIKNHLGKITKSEIMAKCPDISQITVQRALAELLKSGEIIKLGGGRYTSYTWNRERE